MSDSGVVTEEDNEWVEVRDPQSGKTFYANAKTGDCAWEKPENAIIKERNPEGEWWELFDEKNQLSYYYNIENSKTEWTKPTTGTVIKLSAIQRTDMIKRVSVVLGADSQGGNVFPLPEGEAPPVEKDVAVEVKEASGTFEIQHAKLLPGWRQILDTEVGKNYYLNEQTGEKSWDRAVATGKQEKPAMIKIEPIPDDKRSDTLQKAKKLGISGPILNKEAAASMSSLNPGNYQESAQPPTLRKLPVSLASEIAGFKFEDFTKKHFSTHKRGILRRKVPLSDQMCWSKDTIPGPLMNMSKQNAKEAVNCFKLLQKAMRDKGTLKGTAAQGYQLLAEMGIVYAELRDEIYVQLCKQLTKNPSQESVQFGWQLMTVYVVTFPPSKNFEQYLASFFQKYPAEDQKMQTVLKYCERKLERICQAGAKGKVPTVAEIERAVEAPYSPSIFGETLVEVMGMQKESDGDVPKILPFLAEAILKLGGQKAEGVFRVPGDAEMVTELRLRLEKGHYNLEGITDPMVPASLLKLWLRELVDPIIPINLYAEAIKYADEPKQSVALIQKLDPLARKVIYFIIQFLQVIGDPANQPHTKMTVNNLAMVFAPNFLRCPSDNPQTIFENAKLEQNFVRNVILHLNTKAGGSFKADTE